MIERDATNNDVVAPRYDRGDQYRYARSTERGDPEAALLARRVHAKSYLGEKFIFEEAVDEYGQVASDIDKARGEAVDYYTGFDDNGEAVSTLRKIRPIETIGLESLPGYLLCEDTLSDEGKLLLLDASSANRPVREISSFGHIPEVRAQAGLELLRHVMQESYGTDEFWFFTMVTKKYQALVHLFGPQAVRKIGEEIHMDDARVGDVSLTPAVVDTTSFFDDIAQGILDETNPHKRLRMLMALKNFTEGLDRETLSDDVRLLVEDGQLNIATYAQEHLRTDRSNKWTPPLQLNMDNSVDALHAKKLVEDGYVRRVIQPDWSTEGENANEQSGSWFYYPWNESLVQFPDEAAYRSMRHTRDQHLITREEQAALYEKQALFAGLSVGSHVLEHAAYAGVGGSYVLADFDTVSVSNLNRIRTGMAQVGECKVDVFAKRVSELDPYVKLELLRDGVTSQSLEGLTQTPDIIFDEVDDFVAKALLRIYAKEHKIPLIMATDVGYKSVIDIERYDLKDTPMFNGKLNQATIEAMLAGELTPEQRMKITTKLIGLSNASFRLLQSVSDPDLEGFPQLDVTASQGGALATIVARDILLGREVPSGRRVHDARRAMKLPSEVALRDGIVIFKNFLRKN
jgi:hypothetical protein